MAESCPSGSTPQGIVVVAAVAAAVELQHDLEAKFVSDQHIKQNEKVTVKEKKKKNCFVTVNVWCTLDTELFWYKHQMVLIL